jgi:hypothetical protein
MQALALLGTEKVSIVEKLIYRIGLAVEILDNIFTQTPEDNIKKYFLVVLHISWVEDVILARIATSLIVSRSLCILIIGIFIYMYFVLITVCVGVLFEHIFSFSIF